MSQINKQKKQNIILHSDTLAWHMICSETKYHSTFNNVTTCKSWHSQRQQILNNVKHCTNAILFLPAMELPLSEGENLYWPNIFIQASLTKLTEWCTSTNYVHVHVGAWNYICCATMVLLSKDLFLVLV